MSATLSLLLAAGLTACGGGDEPMDPAPTNASPSAKVPTADQLRSVLLGLSDLPTGYAVAPPDPTPEPSSSSAASNPVCAELFDDFKGGQAVQSATQTAEFQKSDLGPFLSQELGAEADAARLSADLTKLRDLIGKCGQFSVTDSDGSKADIRIAAASFPPLGDESAAFQLNANITMGTDTLPMSGYLVAIRVGNTKCSLAHFALGTVEVTETEAVARKAAEKISTVAK